MKVAIRADASPEIGSGHVMRCLTLANALAVRGAQVRFVSRALPGHLAQAIVAAGHSLTTLSLAAPAGSEAPQEAWAPGHQSKDARATMTALADFRPDWAVVDHYGLDRTWERELRPATRHLMAIDDLARLHECDVLLDANLHQDPRARYAASADRTALLLGPAYALLRPEFARARGGVSTRSGPVRRLLVFMGGMDSGNATGGVLEAVALLDEPLPLLDVVVGASHPALAAIEAYCRSRPGSRCHVQTPDLAALLADCDLAVGAGGGATWERCCLGVPTVALALAENQRTVLASAARAGLVYAPDDMPLTPALMATHLQALLHNSALRESLSAAGMAVVDGRGAQRVAAALFGVQIKVRMAVAQDCELVHAWRNAPAVRAFSRQNAEIPLQDHRRWFEEVLRTPGRALLIGEDELGPVGVARFDIQGGEAEVSIYLAPSRLGQGLGPGLLRAAEAWLAANRPDVSAIHAETLVGNAASRRLFENGGYRLAGHRYWKRIEA
jgi:UDP-2,4-diacetamido-2,4,6-trideoxy-beta-L-altropyranose hydrolase